MLHVHVIRGLHAVFGIKRKTGADIDHLIPGDREDVVMEIAPAKAHSPPVVHTAFGW